MSVPTELFIADAVNLVFLSVGGIFLINVLMRFGTEKSKKYAFMMCAGLIGYAIIHEGAEVLHKLQNVDSGLLETAITGSLAIIYAVGAMLMRQEQKKIFEFGGKRHGK